MNDQMNERCACINCPAEGCQCGCEAAVSASPMSHAGLPCACAGSCGCGGAEQGCLCQQ
jgi:hypothetical protein